jgi:DNA-binding beta-propeller fold protein YncE
MPALIVAASLGVMAPAQASTRTMIPATAYVVTSAGTVVPVNTATNKAERPIPVPGGGRIIIAPDRRMAYVHVVVPISTATDKARKPIQISGGAGAIAITPDGKTAYVTGRQTVTPISLAAGTAGKPITLQGVDLDVITILPTARRTTRPGRRPRSSSSTSPRTRRGSPSGPSSTRP